MANFDQHTFPTPVEVAAIEHRARELRAEVVHAGILRVINYVRHAFGALAGAPSAARTSKP